jgi:hypothetical protein
LNNNIKIRDQFFLIFRSLVSDSAGLLSANTSRQLKDHCRLLFIWQPVISINPFQKELVTPVNGKRYDGLLPLGIRTIFQRCMQKIRDFWH